MIATEREAIALLDECVDRLSECAVEIGNLDDPKNPVAQRARATMKAIAEQCRRWQEPSGKQLAGWRRSK